MPPNATSPRNAEADLPVRWLVGVVCICVVLQTAMLIWLAGSTALGTPSAVADSERERVFAALIGGLEQLIWPFVVFGIAVVLRAPLVNIVEIVTASLFARSTSAEQKLLLTWDNIGSSAEGLTSTLSSAYDQYQKPMTEEQRARLKAFVTKSLESGDTESLRERRILWLHKQEGHDEWEADAFRQCGATVQFVFTLKKALDCLERAPAGTYDLVISHMGPTGEGFQLFERMPRHQDPNNFIIYTRKVEDPAFLAEASHRGVHRYTNMPWELFRYVLDAAKSLPPISARRVQLEAAVAPAEPKPSHDTAGALL